MPSLAPSHMSERRPTIGRVRIGVCADDYGLTPGISRGIRELLAAGRISATSVMAGTEYWLSEASALRAFVGSADIGLHITLTDQRPLGPMPKFAPDGAFPPLTAVLKAGLLRQLPLAEIEAEIERQLDTFTKALGAPPAHLDGHHHVHQLPGVRDIVLRIARRLRANGTYTRTCTEPLWAIIRRGVAPNKALLISTLGRGLKRRIEAAGLATNDGFSGVYDFARESRPLSHLFTRFLQGVRSGHLVMCHPGYADAAPAGTALAASDSIVVPREAELAFLAADSWPRTLEAAGIEIGPLRRPAHEPAFNSS